jgi:hypothetical protein
LLGAGCIVWFLWTGWFPVIQEGIRHLPTEGVIENHTLKAPIDPAEPLASSRLLGITADPEDQGSTGITTDLLVGFNRNKVRFCSLLGCSDLPYARISKSTYMPFSRTELEPQWDAWEPILLTIAAVSSFFALLASWFVMASLYFGLVWLFGHTKKKTLSAGGSWRLAGAALMPGAILLCAAIVCYRLGVIDLVSLFSLFLIHFVVGWIYMVMGTLALPKKEPKTPSTNPFSTEPGEGSRLPSGPGQPEAAANVVAIDLPTTGKAPVPEAPAEGSVAPSQEPSGNPPPGQSSGNCG